MEEPFFDVVEFLRRPSIAETFVDILLCAVPIWVAVMIGLVIGWSWRPRWTGLLINQQLISLIPQSLSRFPLSLNLSLCALASSLSVCPLNGREERKTRKKGKEEPGEGK